MEEVDLESRSLADHSFALWSDRMQINEKDPKSQVLADQSLASLSEDVHRVEHWRAE